MASLLSPRRTHPDIALRATVAQTERGGRSDLEPSPPPVGWLLAAIGGALASALIGWIVVAGVSVLAWLTAAPGSFPGALGVGTQLWLLTNGAGAQLDSTTLTLVPYGATLLFGLVLSRFAAFAGRQARTRSPEAPLRATWRTCATLTGVLVATYAAPVVVLKLLVGSPGVSASSVVGVAVVIASAAAWGSCRGLRYRPTEAWPPHWRAVPRAVLGAQLVVVVAGAAALATGLVLHLDRVTALTAGLQAGVAGGLVLLVVQLALLPNAVVWSASYVLGAGFSLGPGSVVAPVSTHLGLLPSVPLLGALPATANGGVSELWWLGSGVLAGAVAAWLALQARPALRFDAASLVGGLVGAGSALVFLGVAWASGGDLGTTRLTGLGPRLLPLLVLAGSTLGLAGLLFGLAVGIVRRALGRRRSRAAGLDAGSPEVSPAG